MNKKFQIIYGDQAVWVNDIDGACVARFGKLGAEIHRGVEDQLNGNGECLICEHTKSTLESWERWATNVLNVLGVKINKKKFPKFLQVVIEKSA